MYQNKQIKNPEAPITEKQMRFLKVLISKKYPNEKYIQQTLIGKLNKMRAGEASDAIKTLLSRGNRE